MKRFGVWAQDLSDQPWGRALLSLVSGLVLSGSTAWSLRYRPTTDTLLSFRREIAAPPS